MKFCALIIIYINIFGILKCLEDFDEELVTPVNQNEQNDTAAELVMPANAVAPDILPTITSNDVSNLMQFDPYCSTNCGTPCPSYCSQVPMMCNPGCRTTPPTTKTIQVPVRVPKLLSENVTRTFPKDSNKIRVSKIYNIIRRCPDNYKLIEDESDMPRCIEGPLSIDCPKNHELINGKCVRKYVICANEYVKIQNTCTARIVCPRNYQQYGNECLPPTPECEYNYRWNGKFCEVERATCPTGYVLGTGFECLQEVTKCPPPLIEVGDKCVKNGGPKCPHDFIFNPMNKICEKTIEKCPPGTYEEYGECYKTSLGCPIGAQERENYCILIETVNKIVYVIKYVTQTITIPGCSYGCTNNCNTGCVTNNCNIGCVTNNCNTGCVTTTCNSGCIQVINNCNSVCSNQVLTNCLLQCVNQVSSSCATNCGTQISTNCAFGC